MDAAIENRVDELLSKMTLAEQVLLCHAGSKFAVSPIERLGIPEWSMSDGPHGVRREIARDSWDPAEGVDDLASYLPTGTALAATWNPELARLHGEVLGAESRERGKDVILGPGINIVRSPLCGRNFEYYAEDPYLISELVVPAIEGIQSQDVAACVKHYACNSQELNRHGVDAIIDERTLREIYLPGFEAAVVRAKVLTLMGAYNLVNGQHCCHHEYLLNTILKGEWGFEGSVISDWDGTYSTEEAGRFGLDVEMGTGKADYEDYYLAAPFREAIERGELPAALAEDKARRNLRVMVATKVLDPETRKPGARNTKAHQQAARRIAEEAVVLLKNDAALLPLGSDVKSILVLGDNATVKHHAGGASSAVKGLYEVTPLEGIRAAAPVGCTVTHMRGYPSEAGGSHIDTALLGLADAGAGVRGWRCNFYDNRHCGGEPRVTRPVDRVDLDWRSGRPFDWLDGRECSAEFITELTPQVSGTYRFVLDGANVAGLGLGRGNLITRWEAGGPDLVTKDVELEAGQNYKLRVFFRPDEDAGKDTVRLTWQPPGASSEDAGLDAVLAAARAADAVIVVGGLSHQYDTEGADRADMDLHDGQNELISAVAAANPRTAVVLVSGSPMALPWIDVVPAVVQLWYAGMEGGHVLGDVVFGAVNPSGKLPMSFPVALQDSPGHQLKDYDADVCRYVEGVFVGYRWFDAKNIAPLFPFGHGLSYTSFAYRDVEVLPGDGSDERVAEVRMTLANTGSCAGSEVVQLYIEPPAGDLPRPPRELKGFAKLTLAAGEERQVAFVIDRRACSAFVPDAAAWLAAPGTYQAVLGSSSRDLRLRGSFSLG
ncbi:MAG: glycoside hydrolase family 3 C-terminal domain-containing protein [Planctomycetota bacterium]|nr:glycoside hydrolase family 3 C-terminal domain-containing protein [Planctomycetota bacterium]